MLVLIINEGKLSCNSSWKWSFWNPLSREKNAQLRWEAKKIGFVTMMKKSESIKKDDLFVDISNLLARFLSF